MVLLFDVLQFSSNLSKFRNDLKGEKLELDFYSNYDEL